MCDLCNGTRRIIEDTGFGHMIQTCPNCGPMTKAEYEAYHKRIRERIAEAEARLDLLEKDVS
ncbi:hypothetical protein ABE402_05940 [Bacillus smithii]|uniref:hypothetical protein n=1 Tax=Bacillus smithii TaxID=1479 RepID=UPI003D193445